MKWSLDMSVSLEFNNIFNIGYVLEVIEVQYMNVCHSYLLTLLHSEWPKLYGVFIILSAVGLMLLFVKYNG